VPAIQLEHEDAPALANVPALHAEQDEEPVSAAADPAEHFKQIEDPEDEAYWPEMQLVQEVAPVAAETVPGEHQLQLWGSPLRAWKVPAAQAVQFMEPTDA